MRTVLEMFLSSVGPRSVNSRSVAPSRYWYIHLVMHMPPGGACALHAHRQVDAAAVEVVASHQHVGEHDAGADLEQLAAGRLDPALVDLALQVGRPLHGRDDAAELGQQAVAHGLEDLAALLADGARDQPVVDPLHEAQGLPFIALHEAGVSHHVERDDRNQTSVGLDHLGAGVPSWRLL